jgi:hypothetical protein
VSLQIVADVRFLFTRPRVASSLDSRKELLVVGSEGEESKGARIAEVIEVILWLQFLIHILLRNRGRREAHGLEQNFHILHPC